MLGGNDLGGRAFALFLRSHPRAFRQVMCPHPREFSYFFKKMLMPGGWPGGHGHCWNPEENILRARTVLSPRFLYYSSLMEKRYLAKWMWLSEDKLRVKIAHFRLPSASQKRACLSSLLMFYHHGPLISSITEFSYVIEEGYKSFLLTAWVKFVKLVFSWKGNYQYSGTPPYDHTVNRTTSLLRPLYSDPNKCSVSHFLI